MIRVIFAPVTHSSCLFLKVAIHCGAQASHLSGSHPEQGRPDAHRVQNKGWPYRRRSNLARGSLSLSHAASADHRSSDYSSSTNAVNNCGGNTEPPGSTATRDGLHPD